MPLPFPYSVRWRWTLWGLKEKLKKPLINPWRLNYARYRQDFSSASFLEQEHAAVFLLQLFPGNSPVPRGGSKAFSKAFLGGRGWLPGKPHCCPRAASRPGAPSSISQISADLWKLLPAGRKLSKFKVRFVCLPSWQTNCYAIFRKSLLSDSIQFIRLRAWKNKY